MKKIYLVDVSSMFFRAFYAIRPLSSTKGVPVNAVYGFISMIAKLLKEKNPEYIVFCYDRKEPSFRKDLDVNYKANRTTMPDDMQVQMPYLKQVAGLFGIADLEVPSFEADDLIGTIATQANAEDFETYIVSGDKDFCQLINDKTFLYDTMKEVVFTPALVKEKHGVTPEQFIDYLAMVGDTSDNIPGVAGIGPKGAIKLIEDFGTLEQIYENIDRIQSAGIKEKLINSKDNAILSKKLVTIVRDVKTNMTLEDYKRKPLNVEPLREFLQELNFKTFEKTLLGDTKLTQPAYTDVAVAALESVSVVAPSDYKIEIKPWDSGIVQKKINSEPFFMFTHNLDLAFGFGADLFHLPLVDVKLNFSNLTWSGFDLKNIWTQLKLSNEDLKSAKIDWDLMLGAYTIRAADCSDLTKLVKVFLQKELSEEITISELYEVILQLNQYVKNDIDQKNLKSIYEKLERPIIPILYQMEQNGIKINVPELKIFSDELGADILRLESEIHELAGEKFNVASPKQLGVILFEKLGLEVIKKTKTGYSTDNDVLEQLKHPITFKMIEFREYSKLKSTYVDALPAIADISGRVHTCFNQALTATGRFSSTNPNIQNIPIKTKIGKRVRDSFVSEDHKKLLSLDYSQIELRVLAHMSNDPGLIAAFEADLDIHAATAAEVFNVKLTDVTTEQRRMAKAVNFGIAYGQGVFGLAETLGISRTESKDIIEKYFQKFKGIKEYIDTTIESAHQKKYVETLFGRRRYIAELSSSNMMMKKFGERAAINAPIQGTASDLVKMAMIDLSRLIQSSTETSGLKMLLQVHDELIFEGTDSEIEDNVSAIKFKMENVAKLRVPLKVNYAVGLNWGQAH
jgi:DNA polymerase I